MHHAHSYHTHTHTYAALDVEAALGEVQGGLLGPLGRGLVPESATCPVGPDLLCGNKSRAEPSRAPVEAQTDRKTLTMD